LLGIGNPLLDIIVQGDKQLLEKYGLDENNAIIAEESHLPLYQEIVSNYEPAFVAGGSAQNTLRVCQWLTPNFTCVYMGSVGRDEFGDILKKKATEDGVLVRYQYQDSVPTGMYAVVKETHSTQL